MLFEISEREYKEAYTDYFRRQAVDKIVCHYCLVEKGKRMLAELCLELDSREIGFQHSSKLQGVLMEHIDTDYAAQLHQNQLHPYSQCITRSKDEKVYWHIRTVTQEAYEKVIFPIAALEKVQLKKGVEAQIIEKKIRTRDESELLKEFYDTPFDKYFNLAFKTPTAFKQNGRYVIYPDVRLIYGSLMRKYSAASTELEMADEETLEELAEQSEIIKYRLQTCQFPLEGIKITGFMGSITIRVRGPETMARYVRMLAGFGEFSGVGIKTSMGMGAIQYIRK